MLNNSNQASLGKINDIYPMQILIIDDNEANIKLLTIQLRTLGYQSDSAADGYIGWQKTMIKQYDLICMDIQMPVMDGFESSRRIIENSLSGSEPFIIAVSSCLYEDVMTQCVDSGISEFLSKPINVTQLRYIIQKYGLMRTSLTLEKCHTLTKNVSTCDCFKDNCTFKEK